jgi:hypothetical protein
MTHDSFWEYFPIKYESNEYSFKEVKSLSGMEFPNEEIVHVILPAKLKTLVFKEVVILKENELIKFGFPHFLEGDLWTESKWSYDTFTRTLAKVAEAKGVYCKFDEGSEYADVPNTVYNIWIAFEFKSETVITIEETLQQTTEILQALIRETEIILDRGIVWKQKYEKDENLFCIEVLSPLLRKMGFLAVRYTHGTQEYGKDFTFSELTKFGELRHYGLQAKAGNISGKVNSQIDEILGQINDAFSMPYYELGSKDARYISVFMVAISGSFTENAKQKLVEKIPKGAIGSVYFIDKEKILELVEKYWLPKENLTT